MLQIDVASMLCRVFCSSISRCAINSSKNVGKKTIAENKILLSKLLFFFFFIVKILYVAVFIARILRERM